MLVINERHDSLSTRSVSWSSTGAGAVFIPKKAMDDEHSMTSKMVTTPPRIVCSIFKCLLVACSLLFSPLQDTESARWVEKMGIMVSLTTCFCESNWHTRIKRATYGWTSRWLSFFFNIWNVFIKQNRNIHKIPLITKRKVHYYNINNTIQYDIKYMNHTTNAHNARTKTLNVLTIVPLS